MSVTLCLYFSGLDWIKAVDNHVLEALTRASRRTAYKENPPIRANIDKGPAFRQIAPQSCQLAMIVAFPRRLPILNPSGYRADRIETHLPTKLGHIDRV